MTPQPQAGAPAVRGVIWTKRWPVRPQAAITALKQLSDASIVVSRKMAWMVTPSPCQTRSTAA